MRLPGVGAGLGRGTVVLYLSLIVLLPLAAVVSEAFSGGWSTFWDQVTSPLANEEPGADRDLLADRRRPQRDLRHDPRLAPGP